MRPFLLSSLWLNRLELELESQAEAAAGPLTRATALGDHGMAKNPSGATRLGSQISGSAQYAKVTATIIIVT